ncbi:MAG: lysylphosphatidylglycerol synthase transmembrane domain-containing protein [Bacteroidales bacterium]|jgi:uncharacterized protein (TIRG00374 family)|nr:flippase-like domain-containing protein [Bacteroidales bacterium]MDD3701285.1 lysylphosphatidylglycerol synthase transmembrane domain-containing protein [Bacteroidales bacterium]MDY0368414.1 lysylphosphatidylglycerol synthase transmembrane domain-containing protein [Bacteroidales bacterium]
MRIFVAKSDEVEDLRNKLRPGRMLYPVLLGLAVAIWVVYRQVDQDIFGFFAWTWIAGWGLLGALLLMGVRDWAYIYRIRVLTNKELSWKQAFQVIMLWEFSSAVSPSVVGGTAPAVYFLHKEGLNTGKSTAVVLTAILLDEVFFILIVPLMYVVFRTNIFPPESVMLSKGLYLILIVGYGIILLYTVLLVYTLFFNPYFFKRLLSWFFLIPFLRPWRSRMRKLSNQLISTSEELRGKSVGYWIKAFLSTTVSWTARYWVVNCMFMAFFFDGLTLFDHFLVFARQLTMWIILLISPTPGGSGLAEFVFSGFLGDLIPNASWALPLAMLWRLISYYPYLIIGAIVMPVWIRRVYAKNPGTSKDETAA